MVCGSQCIQTWPKQDWDQIRLFWTDQNITDSRHKEFVLLRKQAEILCAFPDSWRNFHTRIWFEQARELNIQAVKKFSLNPTNSCNKKCSSFLEAVPWLKDRDNSEAVAFDSVYKISGIDQNASTKKKNSLCIEFSLSSYLPGCHASHCH